MVVKIERDVAEDLISTKLQQIKTRITEILTRWNETNVTEFLTKVRDGTYTGVESDAAEIQKLLTEQKRFKKMLDEGGMKIEKDEDRAISDLWNSEPVITISFEECEKISEETQRKLSSN